MKEWLGYPVKDWVESNSSFDFAKNIYRLNPDWSLSNLDFSLLETVWRFLNTDGVEECPGIVLGDIVDTDELKLATSILVENKEKLPRLRALYIGENDFQISWIEHGAMKPVLESFPGLEELRIQGSSGLTLSPCRNICLKKLVIESGGLSKDVLDGILNSVFPELEHLELWMGTEEYGWNGTEEDLKPFLYESPFPKLTYLGLTNCDQQNEIAKMAADAPVLDQLETLDLSNGTLSDSGGEALLSSDRVKKLKHLNLSHHFMSGDLVKRFEASGLDVNVEGVIEPLGDEYGYYVAVSE